MEYTEKRLVAEKDEKDDDDHIDMDFDRLLIDHVGECGLYQKLVVICLALTGIPCAFTTLEMVFLNMIPDHYCDVGPVSSAMSALNESTFLRLTIPDATTEESYTPHSCIQYDRNYLNATETDINEWMIGGGTTENSTCRKWIFEDGRVSDTIVTEVIIQCYRVKGRIMKYA